MNYNDTLRRLRYTLNLPDPKVLELFELSGHPITRERLAPLFLREDEPGYVECSSELMEWFLDGLIVSRRGKRESEPATPSVPSKSAHSPDHRKKAALTNNDILKALRIALELRDDDIVAIMAASGVTVTKSELGALFRKAGHSNYRPCGDQFLRNFIAGLSRRSRP